METSGEQRAAELRQARSATFWKVIAAASASAGLTVAVMTSARDCHDARRETRRDAEAVGRVQTTSASPSASPGAGARRLPSGDVSAETDVDAGQGSTASAGAPFSRAAPEALESSEPAAPAQDDAAATIGILATPAVATAAALPHAGAPPDAGTTPGTEEPTDRTARVDDAREASASDAGASRRWTPPPMGSGAWPFVTEAPLSGASSFPSDPNAGAGQFATEAPPWAASAFTFDPNAGAGPFTTERNVPAFGGWPYGYGYWEAPPPPPPE